MCREFSFDGRCTEQETTCFDVLYVVLIASLKPIEMGFQKLEKILIMCREFSFDGRCTEQRTTCFDVLYVV